MSAFNVDSCVSLCMCFTGRSSGLQCNYLHLLLLCVSLAYKGRTLAAACGQSVVAAVGGTAGQADNRV